MEVLRKGLPLGRYCLKLKSPRFFACDLCGCIFRAYENEYRRIKDTEYHRDYYRCNCPNCGKEVDETCGRKENDDTYLQKIYEYMHWCDDCSKAYDYTCSGADAKRCEEKRSKLLERENE